MKAADKGLTVPSALYSECPETNCHLGHTTRALTEGLEVFRRVSATDGVIEYFTHLQHKVLVGVTDGDLLVPDSAGPFQRGTRFTRYAIRDWLLANARGSIE